MLITKTNPVGIDVAIQNLQTHLHKKLMPAWNLDPNNADQNKLYESYGRVYRNKAETSHIAEVYIGNDEYKEVYWNNSLHAISFFGTGAKSTFDISNKVDVHLVFFVNLRKLKPTITHRADEEVRNEIQQLFGNTLFGFSFESIELWLENVLREYPGSRRDDRLKAVDMHPVHCFRINLKLLYKPSICNNLNL
jgi:hypothetical protein